MRGNTSVQITLSLQTYISTETILQSAWLEQRLLPVGCDEVGAAAGPGLGALLIPP